MTPPRTILRSNDARATWNFNAGPALWTVRFDNGTSSGSAIDANGREAFRSDDPFALLAWMEAFDLSATPDARWVGFISYEFARHIERLPSNATDDLGFTDAFAFRLHRPAEADGPACDRSERNPATLIGRSMTHASYRACVRRALDYVAAGDVFQINLAQRFSFRAPQTPAEVWQALSTDAPAAHGALLDLGDGKAIVSNSPELFFRIDRRPDGSRRIVNRPIKGTRPNAPGMAEELARSAKDRSELAMIVDLQRNDLGRVCEIGSVVVREPRVIESHPTVYHGVATIDGTLRRDARFADVVRALFPCGSITGCPKIRAMEIIDELEPVARGPYCGAIGYLAADGTAEFNVAIRTIVMSNGVAHVYVGGGIVADSSPQAEYEETLVKARAMLAALGVDAAAL